MATILHSVTQQRLCIEVTVNQTEKTAWILGKYVLLSRTFGVALEHKAALMGIAVQPLARSDSVSEKMKSVVRSSRSCGYLTMTAQCETVQHYVQDDHYTDDSRSEVVVFDCIHIARTVNLPRETRPVLSSSNCRLKILRYGQYSPSCANW